MRSKLFENLTVIIPTIGNIYYDDILYFNLDCLLKLKIKIIIVSNFQLKKIIKNPNLKIIITNKKNAYEKIYLALYHVKTRDVFFQRDDVCIHTSGFIKIYKEFEKNLKLSSCQGIKLIVDKFNIKNFYPHNPHVYDYYNNFLRKQNIFNKIKYCLSYGPECLWTFHRSKFIKKFYQLTKKNYFLDPYILYEYYVIFFLYIYGDIKWVKYPISLQIKFRPDKKSYKSYNEVFLDQSLIRLIDKNLNKIAEMFSNIRCDRSQSKSIVNIKKIMDESLQIRLKNPKPKDLKYNNYLYLIINLFKKYTAKIYFNIFKKSNVPFSNDIYFKSFIKKKNFYDLYFNKNFIKDYKICIDFINNINLNIKYRSSN
jgi:hypothetical protein